MQINIIQVDLLLSLLFFQAMIPINHIIKMWTSGNYFTKSQEDFNHLIYMHDINLFLKK